MRSFQQRNPVRIALVGIAVIALGMVAAWQSDDLPLIGGGTTFTAEFAEAAGIREGNEVRVAGVKVGKVRGVELAGDRVRVSFQVRDTWLGDRTQARIELKSLLGQKYLAVQPAGRRTLDPAEFIPLERTTTLYDVFDAFGDLSETVGKIDTDQLATSFDVISGTLANTPQDLSGALRGLSRLSDTVASRDQELAALLSNSKQLSQTLASRDKQLVRLMKDGNVLLAELSRREQAFRSLLRGTKALAEELTGLIDENAEQIGPVLQDLDRLTGMLHRNRKALADGARAFAPFVRHFNNVIGTGRWFDAYMCGFLLPQTEQLNQHGCDPR